MHRGKQTDMLILDFSKAFDTVPHQRLLQRLNFYGIQSSTHRWIEAWLCHRSQTVILDGESSVSEKVKSGVPQGTVLGPLLFLLYVNNIADDVGSLTRLFADDCLLYRKINNSEDAAALQHDLDIMVEWSKKWQMQFNADKCYVLRVTNKRSTRSSMHSYTMHGKPLKVVDEQAYLEVKLDSKLSWSPQVNNICAKATRMLNFTRRNFHKCSKPVKETVYKTFTGTPSPRVWPVCLGPLHKTSNR
jgi:hypothetical protein